eukprot:3670913-Amphidinium_carterae.1
MVSGDLGSTNWGGVACRSLVPSANTSSPAALEDYSSSESQTQTQSIGRRTLRKRHQRSARRGRTCNACNQAHASAVLATIVKPCSLASCKTRSDIADMRVASGMTYHQVHSSMLSCKVPDWIDLHSAETYNDPATDDSNTTLAVRCEPRTVPLVLAFHDPILNRWERVPDGCLLVHTY